MCYKNLQFLRQSLYLFVFPSEITQNKRVRLFNIYMSFGMFVLLWVTSDCQPNKAIIKTSRQRLFEGIGYWKGKGMKNGENSRMIVKSILSPEFAINIEVFIMSFQSFTKQLNLITAVIALMKLKFNDPEFIIKECPSSQLKT